MARRFKPLPVLEGDQRLASDPSAHAALSASAGTGKTQVLTARVLRLLLAGVRPEAILCLTFTKAGAAEMANRIGARLAAWVRLDDVALRHELFALGERPTPPLMQLARQLFARVLEAPGGLRIQTIHSFAQTLLAAFPAEAGILPGFRPIEGREEQQLARRTLADLLSGAEASGNHSLIEDVQALSLRLGEKDAEAYLMHCARAHDALVKIGPPDGIEAWLRRLIDLPEGDIADLIAERCANGSFDCESLRVIAGANRNWGAATGGGYADSIDSFLGQTPAERAANLDLISAVVTKADGGVRVSSGQTKALPEYELLATAMSDALAELRTLRNGAALVSLQAAGLRAGAAFAEAYARAKRSAGVADFDDLIAWTRRLLDTPGMGEWVRYKLDRRTDHILVDEAQDTNADQWAIVDALAGEYFSGTGAAEARWRTLFMVGDFKQAIFGFQGTDPREFEAMRKKVRGKAESLRDAEDEADASERIALEFRDLSIDASFRSAPAILDVVDAVIAEVGHEAMGLPERPHRHRAHHDDRPGQVTLWRAFADDAAANDNDDEEGWVAPVDRLCASALAKQVRRWLDDAPVLATTRRPMTPGDVLILVRSRGELASLIVARLFAEGVPVAGIDRLHLSKPFAVRDLLAAVGFAVQPLDDLRLANLLVSPLIGWTQDQLYDLAFGRNGRLWSELVARAGEGGHIAAAYEQLGALLAIADFITPARFLESILSGPLDGRRKLLRRLGMAARDPIDELVSSALDYERTEIASLDRFLAWFASGDVEIKRDPSAPSNAVRVMTVHGAKGLEAPVVILADATSDPAKVGGVSRILDLPLPGGTGTAPLLRPRKHEMVEPFATIATEEKARDLEEHWRLLYVGLTRASERLIIAGVQPATRIADDSWYARAERALAGLGAAWAAEEHVGEVIDYRGAIPPRAVRPRAARTQPEPPFLPAWLRQPAPVEARPPRPLSPSALTEDAESAPPPSPAQRQAARRGTLLHALFERLPGVEPGERHAAALRWLECSAGVAEPDIRQEIASAACDIIADPRFADLFGEDSLAEAPIAATLPDGRVVAGKVDRLLVTAEAVRVIDFKTGRSVPENAQSIPPSHRAQMQAYSEALGVIFPGRRIEAVLLYTAAPKLISLDG
ncbi:MAG TPA: double-strand break repair helicase AddA [Sphingomicrobium sp.]|nr:double-strand break repair helicase AddA [Sphingomicrobium sp.]